MSSPIKPRGTASRASTAALPSQVQRGREALLALDANALELFARVVAAGSFAEAARRLGQTRAAVSRRIAAIEAQAGVTLLARTTRSLGLTEAGRRLAAHARGVQEAADAARRSVRSGRAALEGRLRITAVPTFGRLVLAPLLARFQHKHRSLRFELLFTDRQVDLLKEGIDIAFRLTRKPPPDRLAQPVMAYRVGAFAAPAMGAQPLAGPAALADWPGLLLGVSADSVPLLWRKRSGHDDGSDSVRVEVQPAIWSDDMEALVTLARAGAGVVFAPDYCVQADLQAGRLVDLLPGWQLPVAEGELVQALTLPPAIAPRSARELVKFVREACSVELSSEVRPPRTSA